MEQECLNIQQLPNQYVCQSLHCCSCCDPFHLKSQKVNAKGDLEEERINKNDPGVPEDDVIEDVN